MAHMLRNPKLKLLVPGSIQSEGAISPKNLRN